MKDREVFRQEADAAQRRLARRYKPFANVQMAMDAASETVLEVRTVRYTADMEPLCRIEDVLPYLDRAIRECSATIEDIDEVIPAELARRVTERSVRHLAQHTSLIREIDGDRILPSKILNIRRDETYLTYENKFLNTLLLSISEFTKRYLSALRGKNEEEREYRLYYRSKVHRGRSDFHGGAEFCITASVPVTASEENSFSEATQRAASLSHTISAYQNGHFAKVLGKNVVRPPIVRTNAILKNKNLRACLELWEYLSRYDGDFVTASYGEYSALPSRRIDGNSSAAALRFMELCYAAEQEEQARNESDPPK